MHGTRENCIGTTMADPNVHKWSVEIAIGARPIIGRFQVTVDVPPIWIFIMGGGWPRGHRIRERHGLMLCQRFVSSHDPSAKTLSSAAIIRARMTFTTGSCAPLCTRQEAKVFCDTVIAFPALIHIHKTYIYIYVLQLRKKSVNFRVRYLAECNMNRWFQLIMQCLLSEFVSPAYRKAIIQIKDTRRMFWEDLGLAVSISLTIA